MVREEPSTSGPGPSFPVSTTGVVLSLKFFCWVSQWKLSGSETGVLEGRSGLKRLGVKTLPFLSSPTY